ncbi:MAG: hypothetical protein JOZ71_03850, partial [Ktedonobacteraceae bacterium]|nr:hypothetical protein [Ktedonobacteraceae bacterium]
MADRIPTLADVCSAIAEGKVEATKDGSVYHVNAYELRRYLNKFRVLPSLSADPAPVCDNRHWSASAQIFIA